MAAVPRRCSATCVARWLPAHAARCAGSSRCRRRGCCSNGGAAGSCPASPWLSLGYSQTDTWLARLRAAGRRVRHQRAAAGLRRRAGRARARRTRRRALAALVVLVLPWTAGAGALRHVDWTHAVGRAGARWRSCRARSRRTMKWLREQPQTRPSNLYRDLHRAGAGHAADRVAGVRAAGSRQRARRLHRATSSREARAHGSAMCDGRAARRGRRAEQRYFNSVLALGDTVQLVRQAPSGAVRRILPGAALRAHLAAPDEPAVLGLHARRGRRSRRWRRPA